MPSDRVISMVLPSSVEIGKLVPVIVMMLSPCGLRAVVGYTEVTLTGTSTTSKDGSRGT